MNFAKLEQRITALENKCFSSLRFGVVTEVNTQDGTAKAQLLDGDKMQTKALKVLQPRSLKQKSQCLPEIGSPCACLFSGQGQEQGVILGTFFTPKNPAPNQEASLDYKIYADGTELSYDPQNHVLTVQCQGQITMQSIGDITLKADDKINLQAPMIKFKGKVENANS